ncbi:hypothetical protein Dimus_026691, partial [Dionaea muscipula]
MSGPGRGDEEADDKEGNDEEAGEQDLVDDKEAAVDLLPDDWEDLVPEDGDLNNEERHEEGSIETVRIQADMEELRGYQGEGESCSTTNDPFKIVMPRQHPGRVRLLGKSVTRSDLKASSSTNTSIDGIRVNVPVDLVKFITAIVKAELIQEILPTLLLNLQRGIPNLDSESILAGLAVGVHSPRDVVSGHGMRNVSSSAAATDHTPSFTR